MKDEEKTGSVNACLQHNPEDRNQGSPECLHCLSSSESAQRSTMNSNVLNTLGDDETGLFRYSPPHPPALLTKLLSPLSDAQLSSMVQVSV